METDTVMLLLAFRACLLIYAILFYEGLKHG